MLSRLTLLSGQNSQDHSKVTSPIRVYNKKEHDHQHDNYESSAVNLNTENIVDDEDEDTFNYQDASAFRSIGGPLTARD